MVKRWLLLAAVAMTVLQVSIGLAHATPSLDRWVIGGGGGSATVNKINLNGTIGQWAVGVGESSPYRLCSGFWGCGELYQIFLPVVLRQ